MKQLVAMLLSLVTALSLAGCGAQERNEISALFEEGYQPTSANYGETSWVGIFQKHGGWDSVYLVTAAMTPELYAAFADIGFEDEDGKKEKGLFGQLTNVTVTDITDRVPSQDAFASYIGMTMGELEAAGFEKTGYSSGYETGYEFFYDGSEYSLLITPAEKIDDLDNYSENDLRALKIGGVEFSGFSSQFLDANDITG